MGVWGFEIIDPHGIRRQAQLWVDQVTIGIDSSDKRRCSGNGHLTLTGGHEALAMCVCAMCGNKH
jgi:hypothetical protein